MRLHEEVRADAGTRVDEKPTGAQLSTVDPATMRQSAHSMRTSRPIVDVALVEPAQVFTDIPPCVDAPGCASGFLNSLSV